MLVITALTQVAKHILCHHRQHKCIIVTLQTYQPSCHGLISFACMIIICNSLCTYYYVL
jgi:hypothetical protein